MPTINRNDVDPVFEDAKEASLPVRAKGPSRQPEGVAGDNPDETPSEGPRSWTTAAPGSAAVAAAADQGIAASAAESRLHRGDHATEEPATSAEDSEAPATEGAAAEDASAQDGVSTALDDELQAGNETVEELRILDPPPGDVYSGEPLE